MRLSHSTHSLEAGPIEDLPPARPFFHRRAASSEEPVRGEVTRLRTRHVKSTIKTKRKSLHPRHELAAAHADPNTCLDDASPLLTSHATPRPSFPPPPRLQRSLPLDELEEEIAQAYQREVAQVFNGMGVRPPRAGSQQGCTEGGSEPRTATNSSSPHGLSPSPEAATQYNTHLPLSSAYLTALPPPVNEEHNSSSEGPSDVYSCHGDHDTVVSVAEEDNNEEDPPEDRQVGLEVSEADPPPRLSASDSPSQTQAPIISASAISKLQLYRKLWEQRSHQVNPPPPSSEDLTERCQSPVAEEVVFSGPTTTISTVVSQRPSGYAPVASSIPVEEICLEADSPTSPTPSTATISDGCPDDDAASAPKAASTSPPSATVEPFCGHSTAPLEEVPYPEQGVVRRLSFDTAEEEDGSALMVGTADAEGVERALELEASLPEIPTAFHSAFNDEEEWSIADGQRAAGEAVLDKMLQNGSDAGSVSPLTVSPLLDPHTWLCTTNSGTEEDEAIAYGSLERYYAWLADHERSFSQKQLYSGQGGTEGPVLVNKCGRALHLPFHTHLPPRAPCPPPCAVPSSAEEDLRWAASVDVFLGMPTNSHSTL
jgi:hypothetical protein